MGCTYRKPNCPCLGSSEADLKISPKMFIKHNACILSENYEIGCKLGSGAYGVVRMAQHKLTNQTRAIKSINKTKVSSDQLSSSKFVSEIDNLMNSDHPNIVRLYEFYEDEKY